jgi:hypothetical protein
MIKNAEEKGREAEREKEKAKEKQIQHDKLAIEIEALSPIIAELEKRVKEKSRKNYMETSRKLREETSSILSEPAPAPSKPVPAPSKPVPAPSKPVPAPSKPVPAPSRRITAANIGRVTPLTNNQQRKQRMVQSFKARLDSTKAPTFIKKGGSLRKRNVTKSIRRVTRKRRT